MARIEDVVKQATSEISQLVKEVRESDEDDLSKLASSFDQISERADTTANLLSRADEALGGSNGGGEQGQQPAEEQEQQQAGKGKRRKPDEESGEA